MPDARRLTIPRARGEQVAALAELAETLPDPDSSPDRIRQIVAALGHVPAALAAAKPADKAELYGLLNVALVYDPATRTAKAEAGIRTSAAPARPAAVACTKNGVRGGT